MVHTVCNFCVRRGEGSKVMYLYLPWDGRSNQFSLISYLWQLPETRQKGMRRHKCLPAEITGFVRVALPLGRAGEAVVCPPRPRCYLPSLVCRILERLCLLWLISSGEPQRGLWKSQPREWSSWAARLGKHPLLATLETALPKYVFSFLPVGIITLRLQNHRKFPLESYWEMGRSEETIVPVAKELQFGGKPHSSPNSLQ